MLFRQNQGRENLSRSHPLNAYGGVILDFELTPSNADERTVDVNTLPLHHGRMYLAGKGYICAEFAAYLRQYGGGFHCITPYQPA